jgi:di/tricarboxylate transporter
VEHAVTGTCRADHLTVSGEQLGFSAILLASFGLLLTERLRNDVVAVLIIIAVTVAGILEPREAMAGFGSEPAIVVAAVFVLSGALHQTGLSDTIGTWIGRLAGQGQTRATAVIMPAVALLSAFTHHLTTTAVMLPVTLRLSRERGIAPSRLLMPLAFAASLGTTITIIGAPAFLIASSALRQAGRPGLGVFSIAPLGLLLSALGTLFMLLVGRFLLPDRRGGDAGAGRFRLDDYFTEVTILEGSPLAGRTIDELQKDRPLRVVGWIRKGRRIDRPFDDRALEVGDVLLVRTTPDEIIAFRQERGVDLHPVAQYATAPGHADEDEEAARLVQAVVAPQSDLVGRTVGEVDFRRRFGAIVLGLWRQSGWLDQELAQTRLHAGDVLVIHGDDEALERVERDPRFLMLVPFHAESRPRQRAPLAAAIMGATVLAAALEVVSIEIAALAGAAAMVLTRCITAGQAYRAIDARIFVFIAGALALGSGMEKSGTSEWLAGQLQGLLGDAPQDLVLLVLFVTVAVATQFMSDSATTALFAPVAVALADGLGGSPEAYVVTVAMASVASFLTPIGHHGNLLIYGPGGYRFWDFVRVGAPLTALVGVAVVLMAPLLWPA